MASPKVLVCGGRDFDNRTKFAFELDRIFWDKGWIGAQDEVGNFLYDVHIISGGAKGADTLAIDWAVVNWSNWTEFPADWDKYGKKAGPIRNQQMLDEGKPDLVIAFPTKNSRGTYDMIRRAEKAGVPVITIED